MQATTFKHQVEAGELHELQIRTRIVRDVRAYLKARGYDQKVSVRYVKGYYQLKNGPLYGFIAKAVFEEATGLEFIGMTQAEAVLVTEKLT